MLKAETIIAREQLKIIKERRGKIGRWSQMGA
jgi:hypothetical protein